MPEEEYEKQLWILTAFGTLRGKEEKIATSEEITEILNNSECPYSDFESENVEERINKFKNLGLVSEFPRENKMRLDPIDIPNWG